MLLDLWVRALSSLAFCPHCCGNLSPDAATCPDCGELHVQERYKAAALAGVSAVSAMFIWRSDLIALLTFWGTYTGLAELFFGDDR